MDTLLLNDKRPALGIHATKNAPVIVATDGQAQSDSAVILGNLIAGSREALRVLSVLRASPVVPDVGVSMTTDIDRIRRADLLDAARNQTARHFGQPYGVEVFDGDPASIVARAAHEATASLIVCGLGRHNVVDRILGDETALRLVRLADVPVLAVASGQGRAPATIVVASDFTETSLRAARMAVALAAPGATIYLVHVAPRDGSRYEWDGWGNEYKQDALDQLAHTRQHLHVDDRAVLQSIMLQGDPATEILRFAENVRADLIATGSHGHGFVARLLIGSVATRIVRAATCSVLTVPHAAVVTDVRTKVLPPLGRAVPRDDWATVLEDFSRRNAGRLSLLEVDDADIGAQAQEFDYPFQGCVFDHNDQRIALMFGGDASAGRHHLTRGIANPVSVDILTDRGGTDIAMRVAHGQGQTLLTFVG
jgi:nucleotide-binding universal stress UspA family protein